MKITSGFFAFITFAAIFIQSNVLLRHAFYETFLHVHQALAVIAVALLWVHLRANHPMKSLLITALAVWLADVSTLQRGLHHASSTTDSHASAYTVF